MFTPTARNQLLEELLVRARADESVTAAALVGSAARHENDRWSDIDLAIRLDSQTAPGAAAEAWTGHLASIREVAHHLDIWSGPVLYRVFLLADSLQIDLSFWPAEHFSSTGEPFELLFGDANPRVEPSAVDVDAVIGWAWLYALHTRSALARARSWQGVQMLNGLRDQVITLSCLRHSLPSHQGRGVDRLPSPLLNLLDDTLIARPDRHVLAAAFRAAISLLLVEVEHVDTALAARLRVPLTTLNETAA